MLTLLYRIYQIVIVLPIFLIITIITAITTIIGSLFNAHVWGYYPGKIWCMLTCRLLLLPVKTQGHKLIDKRTSYVFVANHQGVFDIFLIYGFLGRNFKWMMKQSLRNIPFVGKACEAAKHIFVDKSSPKRIQESIDRACKVLQGGTSLVVFPEGARTFTGHMRPFKKGAFVLADELQMPVVPMTINGSFDTLPRTGGFIKWHKLSLTIHEPIFPQSKGHDNVKDTMQKSFAAIEKALPTEYQGVVNETRKTED